LEIKGAVAIVTGAARGIGQATAMALAKAGAKAVVLVDIKETELAKTARLIESEGAEAVISYTDVGDLASLQSLFAKVETRFGRLDILHNNAGIGEGSSEWPNVTPERLINIINVNLSGVILGTQLSLDLMKKSGGGVIVNTASGGAFMPLPPQAVYVATKAGVVHFTRSCEPLFESHGVRVNCICPGLVDTEMVKETGDGIAADWLQPLVTSVKLLLPKDIANAVLDFVREDNKVAEILSINNQPLA
tara:strand:+ start:211 stop:954 length:744 start_codon:yes stop_codon:yes gene_type:complete